MRVSSCLFASLLLLACSDPPCPPNQIKLGKSCFPAKSAGDGGTEGTDSEEGETLGADARVDAAPQGTDASNEQVLDASDASEVDAADTDSGPAEDVDSGISADAEVDAGPTCTPSAEVCDGKDNDCDQQIDEDVTDPSIGTACPSGGQGACAAPGKYACFSGAIICNASAAPTTEVCDGIDNDCKNGVDDGLKNACGGTTCGADLKQRGQKCTAGQGDCQGEGTWECDPTQANNALRCTAVEKQKNACGASCGPLPAETCDGVDNNCNGSTDEGVKNACGKCGPLAEKCDTAEDDNCDGQINEGCCGDGNVSLLEECDPTAAPWSPWTCSQLCQRNNLYSPCLSNADCQGAVGNRTVECFVEYAICAIRCTPGSAATPCPAPPGNGSASCIGFGDLPPRCIIDSCTLPTNAGCAAGSSCVGSNTSTWCLGCDRHAHCPSNQHCEFQGSFGMCKLGPP